jgi:hypothetical protein
MAVRSSYQTYCYVDDDGHNKEIGIPKEQVFCLTEGRFETLFGAYISDDLHHLCTLYSQIAVDGIACEKYQDK